MKKHLILSALLLLTTFAFAQEERVDFDSLIMPINDPSFEFQEYLVQLAWLNNPANRALDHKIRVAEEDVTIAKWDWAEDVGFTFNLNENNIRSREGIPNATPQALMAPANGGITQEELNTLDASRGLVDLGGVNNFPIYNLGVVVNLGRWINRDNEIRKARENVKIEEANLDQEKLELRSEVIRRYQAYLHAIEIYKIRVQSEEDIAQTFQLVSKRFKDGTVDFEDYNRASNANLSAKEATLMTKGDITSAKIDVEEIIGIALERAKAFHDKAIAN